MILLLKKIFLITTSIGLCFSQLFLYPLLLFITFRIYSKSSTSLVLFLDWLLKGQNGFTLVYMIWLIYNGTYLFEYVPVIFHCWIMNIEFQQQHTPLAKDKQLKQDITILKNKMEIIVFLYALFSSIGSISMLWRVMSNGFLLKIKYGFNPYLQLIFKLAHITMLDLVNSIPPLLYIYRIVYRIISLFGRVYIQKRIISGRGS